MADIGHNLLHAEDHGLGGTILFAHTIHIAIHGKVLRIRDFILRHQPGAERAESIEPLALIPSAAAFRLPFTLRHVIADRITGHMIQRLIF